MTVKSLRDNLNPVNGHLLSFKFSRYPQVMRHRWEGTERLPDEQTIRSLGQSRDGKIFFAPIAAFPADLSMKLQLAEVYADFALFCKMVGFCSNLTFGGGEEEGVLVRSATFSDSMLYGDSQAQEMPQSIVQAFLGQELSDYKSAMMFVNLQSKTRAGIEPSSGMLFLAHIANAMGRLKINHGQREKTPISPLGVLFYAAAYEREALATVTNGLIRANAVNRDRKKVAAIQELLPLIEEATQSLGMLYDGVKQGGELVRFRLPRYLPHNLGPRDAYPVALAA